MSYLTQIEVKGRSVVLVNKLYLQIAKEKSRININLFLKRRSKWICKSNQES